jgi:hypothetical protein
MNSRPEKEFEEFKELQEFRIPPALAAFEPDKPVLARNVIRSEPTQFLNSLNSLNSSNSLNSLFSLL